MHNSETTYQGNPHGSSADLMIQIQAPLTRVSSKKCESNKQRVSNFNFHEAQLLEQGMGFYKLSAQESGKNVLVEVGRFRGSIRL